MSETKVVALREAINLATVSYTHLRVKHATIYVLNQKGLKNLFKLVSLSNVTYFAGVARIPRTILDQYRDGLLLGTACSDGEVFDTVLSKGVEAVSYTHLDVYKRQACHREH